MIETQFKTLKGPFTFFPELQFAQYMLPCFVASFLDMEKDKTVSSEVKEKYLNFVHLLVSNYERYPFSQQLTSKKRKIPFAHTAFITSSNKGDSIVMAGHTISILRKIVAVPKFENAFNRGILYLFQYNPHFGIYKDISFEELCPWGLQLSMFYSRIHHVFKDNYGINNCGYDIYEKMLLVNNFFELYSLAGETTENNSLDRLITFLIIERYKLKVRAPVKFSLEEIHDSTLVKDSSTLQTLKLAGIAFFQNMTNVNKMNQAKEDLKFYQGPYFPLNKIDKAVWARMSEDYWTLKQLVLPLRATDPDEKSPLASLELAKSNLCYEFVLKALIPEGKVPMSRPGEITFFPVQHCRWCGQVEGVAEFRVCPECLENPEYPDANFFCSEKCEKESLDSQHTEEHVRFLLIKCELSN